MHALQGKDSKQQVPPFNPLELKLDESASKTNSVDSRDEKTELILHDSVASKEDMSKKVNFSIANRSNDAIDAKPSNKMMAKIQKVRDRRGNRHQSSTGVLEKVAHEPDQMGTTHVSKISARRQTYDQTADVKVFGGADNMAFTTAGPYRGASSRLSFDIASMSVGRMFRFTTKVRSKASSSARIWPSTPPAQTLANSQSMLAVST